MEYRASDYLDLANYRQKVAQMYAEVRQSTLDDKATWHRYRDARENLICSHPQSALSMIQKQRFKGLPYFDYDPGLRFEVEPISIKPEAIELNLEHEGLTRLSRFAEVSFSLSGAEQRLSLFWFSSYGGGIFLPFRDATNGTTTYGGGRYLLDTIKGADLGSEGRQLILDFNYAYNPSCVYNARWHCPLAPPENTISLPVLAGELTYPDPE